MFFLASKILDVLLLPSSVLILATVIGIAALRSRYARLGRALTIGAVAALVICGFGPMGAILLRPLEDRFASPSENMPAPTGIVVLGGAINPAASDARGAVSLASGGRIVAAVALARRYPEARLVFSGHSATVFGNKIDEANLARRMFVSMGIPPARITLEDRSRNTAENAQFTRALVNPKVGERWLLVTSAAHMPRAIGAFRQAGFAPVPYPVDYMTTGRLSDFWSLHMDAGGGLAQTDMAMHEWIGLLAYRLTGKTDALLPGPARSWKAPS